MPRLVRRVLILLANLSFIAIRFTSTSAHDEPPLHFTMFEEALQSLALNSGAACRAREGDLASLIDRRCNAGETSFYTGLKRIF